MNPATGLPRIALAAAWMALAVRPAAAAPVTVKPFTPPAHLGAAVQVRPGAFNAAGNLLIGYAGDERGDDALLELNPAGATVWECRLRPVLFWLRQSPPA